MKYEQELYAKLTKFVKAPSWIYLEGIKQSWLHTDIIESL